MKNPLFSLALSLNTTILNIKLHDRHPPRVKSYRIDSFQGKTAKIPLKRI
jgi:hypothetical protein